MTAAFAEERRQQIAELVATQGRVRVTDLVARFEVSEPTLRKDLSELERQHLVRRTHGGAIAIQPRFEPGMQDRVLQSPDAKVWIARACLAEIGRGDSVFLDTGTTVQQLADRLDRPDVNVLTNAVGVAMALADRPAIRHTLLGGQFRALGGSLVGPITLETLARFTVNIAFVSASGVTSDGLSVADVAEAQLKLAVIERARKVVVPVDSSKFGTTDFVRVCGLERVDVIVTEQASDDVVEWCDAHDVTLRIATD